MRIFTLNCGMSFKCPDNACVFCDHCTDIFYDYTNRIYMLVCRLHDNPNGQGCHDFREGGNNDK